MKLQNYVASTDPERYENGGVRDWLAKILSYAQDHNNVVQKFGRYPHRNKHLGRESTPEEIAHMEASTDIWAK